MNKKNKLKSFKSKVVEYKQHGNIALQHLVMSQDQGMQIDHEYYDIINQPGYALNMFQFMLI